MQHGGRQSLGTRLQRDRVEQDSRETESPESTSFGARMGREFLETLVAFAPLGLVAFGGPPAHIALLHAEFVERRRWIPPSVFLELMALGQGLPGPTSTQMVLMVATARGGMLAGLVAFIMWTLPGFSLLTPAGYGVARNPAVPNYIQGLAPAAISLVFIAAFKITAKVCSSDPFKLIIATATACTTILVQTSDGYNPTTFSWLFPAMLVGAGFLYLCLRGERRNSEFQKMHDGDDEDHDGWWESKKFTLPIGISLGVAALVLWTGLLAVSSSLRWGGYLVNYPRCMQYFEAFYRMGSLIYGGGQVVLPMMLTEVTQQGWVTEDEYYDGLGLVQALPGPLFNFASFLGAAASADQGLVSSIVSALSAWSGIFLPGILLIFGVAPFWMRLRESRIFKEFLQGVNAASAGLVVSACVLLWEGAISSGADASVAMITGTLVGLVGVPAPIGIAAGAAAGAALGPSGLNLGTNGLRGHSISSQPPMPPSYNYDDSTYG